MGGEPSKENLQARIDAEESELAAEHQNAVRALQELDAKTKVPHLLIEIRSFGFLELQGKNTGGIYEKLDQWFKRNWRLQDHMHGLRSVAPDHQDCGCCGYTARLELLEIQDHHRLCDRSWTFGPMGSEGCPSGNGVYKCRGSEGENNMGKLTMDLVTFMTNECGWTFQICDSGNLGYRGDIREQQIKFKAPHPLNLIAPHIMIELRQVGYVEINGPDTGGIYGKLGKFLTLKWHCHKYQHDPDYCALKFSTNAFKSRGSEGENNMGMRTMELVDFMVKEMAWTMVTCNGGNFGRRGDKREQQLVFRNDEFVQHGEEHIMVELRTKGYIEVNGLHDGGDIGPLLDNFLRQQWGAQDYKPYLWESGEMFCDKKYTMPNSFYYLDGLTNNLGKRTIELAGFLGQHGWSLLLCNGGSLMPDPPSHINDIIREQQVKFTHAKRPEKAKEPLLMIEFRTYPYSDEPPSWNGFIEICGANTNRVYEHLDTFIREQMGGQMQGRMPHCDRCYMCNKFRLKPSKRHEQGRWDGYMNGESNMGKWTMRICDFMVDHLGEWDLIVCNSDNMDRSFRHGSGADKYVNSVTAREMQMVFRHKPGGRAVFMSASNVEPLGRPPLQPPQYWVTPECCGGTLGHKLIPGTQEELGWMQGILDTTFKKKATRDRTDGAPLADRFMAVQCLRSEHPALWDKFAERRRTLLNLYKDRPGVQDEFLVPKTMACEGLSARCSHGKVGNPTNQAYLLHGTNPTSAVAILGRSFTIDFAGKGAGTMFGPGVYLAESSTKADEYARDDVGGEYDGLYALLVCRAVLGRPYVTLKAGNFMDKVRSDEFGHVLGDREKAVGTFREFVLFHEESIYPEYAVFYRRMIGGEVMKRTEAPELMVMKDG
mmetsp:Transcript_56442/g.175098  ORF Transcript_56442/g.175098 Transcript_56442/m.175098 type:complete len:880 (-) Transcript_56442:72-2711(-)